MQQSRIHPALAEALAARGYDTLTSVQSAVIEDEAHGRDLIVSAKTGSGKTVAFGLAIAGQLLEGDRAPWTREPLGLVIAPTRELAIQVSKELEWLYASAGARVVTCVGGMDPMKERRALQGGAHIVVGTPGRLRDHLERGALDLSALRVAVLDEADEMLDMGFREELEEILDATPGERRTLLFSATMPRPDRRAGQALPEGRAADRNASATARRMPTSPTRRWPFPRPTSSMPWSTCCACTRRKRPSCSARPARRCGGCTPALPSAASTRSPCPASIARASATMRCRALRDKRARVCVATDVAARGIDLPSVSLVIHVELPRDAEALQHRSGRTGRAGRKGIAVLIVPFRRRRNVETMLRNARIEAEWIDPPSPEQIRVEGPRAAARHRFRRRSRSTRRIGSWPSS